MKNKNNNTNLERCLKAMAKYGIEDEKDLNIRLNALTRDDSDIFKERWGLDGEFCQTFTQLAEKRFDIVTSVKTDYLIAERRVIELEYYKYLSDWRDYNIDHFDLRWKEYDHRKAIMLGNIVKKAGITSRVCGHKLEDYIYNHFSDRDTEILELCAGKSLKERSFLSEKYKLSADKITVIVERTLSDIKEAYKKGLF